MTVDKNCLSYWFPRLRDAGIPVPKTEIIDVGDDWHKMTGFMDNPRQHPESYHYAIAMIRDLAKKIIDAAGKVGDFPVFLRTGLGSGKHRWKECCDLQRASDIESHICALVEWSEMVDMMGLPYRIWCVRERLPVNALAFLPGYGDMPLVREKRFFIEGGAVVCSHPYWPLKAIAEGLPRIVGTAAEDTPADEESILVDVYDEPILDMEKASDLFLKSGMIDSPGLDEMTRLAQQVAMVFRDDGAWSVDVLETQRGTFGSFYVTDLAVAKRSFHWPDCPNANRFQ